MVPPPAFTPAVLLPLVGAGQALFVAVLLATQPAGTRRANRLLAGFFLVFACSLAKLALAASGLAMALPQFGRVTYPLELLAGPLFYGYVRVLTGHRLTRGALRHLLPALAGAVVLVPFYLAPSDEKRRLLAEAVSWRSPAVLLLWLGNWGTLTGYLAAALAELARHDARLRAHVSSLTHAGLAWLRRLALVLLAGQGLEFAHFLTAVTVGPRDGLALLGALTTAGVLYALAFIALRQPELRYVLPERFGAERLATREWMAVAAPGSAAGEPPAPPVVVLPTVMETAEESAKYARSRLAPSQMETIAARLRGLMEQERLFLDAELALVDLADRVGCPTHQLSQTLNEHLGVSFFDFVNRYRVEEAKRLLADPRIADRSVLTIGFDAGFNSKTAFNTSFKQLTSQTPTAYRRSAQSGTDRDRPAATAA